MGKTELIKTSLESGVCWSGASNIVIPLVFTDCGIQLWHLGWPHSISFSLDNTEGSGFCCVRLSLVLEACFLIPSAGAFVSGGALGKRQPDAVGTERY